MRSVLSMALRYRPRSEPELIARHVEKKKSAPTSSRKPRKERHMKYMLLIHHNPTFELPEPMENIRDEVGGLIDELKASGEWVGGEGLADVSHSKVVRVREGVP